MDASQAAEIIRSAIQGVFETMLGTELTARELFEERVQADGSLFIAKPVSEEKLLPFLEQISGS